MRSINVLEELAFKVIALLVTVLGFVFGVKSYGNARANKAVTEHELEQANEGIEDAAKANEIEDAVKTMDIDKLRAIVDDGVRRDSEN